MHHSLMWYAFTYLDRWYTDFVAIILTLSYAFWKKHRKLPNPPRFAPRQDFPRSNRWSR